MYKLFSVLLLLLVVLFGCIESNDFDAFTIGDDFVKSETNISIVDTFAVKLSTFKLDSIPTSGQKIGLFGSYVDKELGIVQAKCYIELGVPSEGYSLVEKDEFDSLTVKMRYHTLNYGDTLKDQHINIYRLTEELDPNANGYLYNLSSFIHESEPIGSVVITRQMRKDNKDMEIRLNDELGKDLFKKLYDKSRDLKDNANFLEYFPGIVISSETSDGAILSISFSEESFFSMNVYAHRYEYEKVNTEIVFPMINLSHQYNQITCNRVGTNAEPITDNSRNDIISGLTGNQSFVQGGIGLYTRIEFPGLYRMLEMDQKRFLLRAELFLRPIPHSFDDLPLPNSLAIFESNKVNQNIGALKTADGKSNLVANVVTDKYHPEETFYSFDVTSFISSELADGFFDVNHALLIGLNDNDMSSSVQRITIADKSIAKYKPVLKLYYAFYN